MHSVRSWGGGECTLKPRLPTPVSPNTQDEHRQVQKYLLFNFGRAHLGKVILSRVIFTILLPSIF